jgi:hypothetical protein
MNPQPRLAACGVLIAVAACAGPVLPDVLQQPVALATAARTALARDEWLLVQLTRPDRPACAAMAATLAAPLALDSQRGFAPVELDARAAGARFASWLGGQGSLATIVLDPLDGEPIAVLRGYADAAEYAAFLAEARALAPRVRAARAAWNACPGDTEAALALGSLLHRLGCPHAARGPLLQLVRHGAPAVARAAACARLARLAIDSGDARAARDWLQRSHGADAEEAPDRVLTEGLILLAERRAGAAAERLETGLRDGCAPPGEAAGLRIALARAHHEVGRDDDALRALLTLATQPRWQRAANEEIEHIRTQPGHTH